MALNGRAYRDDEADLASMRAVVRRGRMAAGKAGAYYPHIGDLAWWLFHAGQDDDRRQTIRLWEDDDGQAAGWSLLSPDFGGLDVCVLPEHRGAAELETMWADTEQRLAALLVGSRHAHLTAMWVADDDDALTALLEERGYNRAEDFMWALARPLAGELPEAAVPDGFVLRPVAGAHEAPARALASHAAFNSRLTVEAHAARYARFMRSPVYPAGHDLVALTPEGRVAAFTVCWHDSVTSVGLFEPVGARPDYQRRGLARAVMLAGLRQMQRAGLQSAQVCVEYNNLAAIGLYEGLGFEPVCKLITFKKGL